MIGLGFTRERVDPPLAQNSGEGGCGLGSGRVRNVAAILDAAAPSKRHYIIVHTQIIRQNGI